MDKERQAKIGFGIAIAGMAVTALTLVPAFSENQFFPWPLIAGSMIYILGSFYFIAHARGDFAKVAMTRLRIVRVAIFLIVVIHIQQMIKR